MSDRTVERLAGDEWAIAATLALAGLGIAAGSQLLVAAATLPLWYVAAAAFGTNQPSMVRVNRRISVRDGASGGPIDDADESTNSGSATVSADPGETVTVRTTVQNAGSDTIVDLRVVDGVPDTLPVVSGSPRACETLEPLEETTLEYELEPRRGEHAFDDVTVRTRDLTGTVAETWRAGAGGDDAVRCSPVVESVSLGDGANDYAGEVPTDEGGSGLEFYAVREYEPGDPVRSIDWRRYAGSRELATIEYRAERATRIVCVVDARPSQFRAATTARPPAIERSAEAAEQALEALVAAGHPTGVVGFHEQRLTTVAPGTDPATRREASQLLEGVREADFLGYRSSDRTRTDDPVADLPRALPGEAQVYLFSSFVDDEPVDLVERLRARGYAVRVISPDVTTAADDIATRLESLDRETRLARARATGARVIDWDREQSLGVLLRNAIRKGGRR
ncbi:DUF58 domain-containing protein [Natrinema versiforme]|uniref:DUF58 domain-containing protein n=1 Tax=Natrinema versiforme JCM 10478 TaxID=1227496 RepID=L9YCQ5_9EURY|nr:DUF58 domain-containing protein [Natrinema versiforme]ELY71406.1 hypothetical protein C489_00521 [Natrinema versiforme JCM 10478]